MGTQNQDQGRQNQADEKRPNPQQQGTNQPGGTDSRRQQEQQGERGRVAKQDAIDSGDSDDEANEATQSDHAGNQDRKGKTS